MSPSHLSFGSSPLNSSENSLDDEVYCGPQTFWQLPNTTHLILLELGKIKIVGAYRMVCRGLSQGFEEAFVGVLSLLRL